MYFPYVRGKQFDLIAIRELVEDGLLTEKIIPVVEPINLTSTLISTIKTCVDHEKRIAVIHNPQVGVFRSKYSDSNNEELKNEFNELMNDEYELYAHILNEESKSELNDLSDMGIHGSDMLVVHNKLDYIDFYNEYWLESNKFFAVKGGSFLCHSSYCNRYRLGARNQLAANTTSSNLGFRCVSL